MEKDCKEYSSEADVETKFIYSELLTNILNIPTNLVKLHVPVTITQGRQKTTKEADVVIKNDKNENIIVIDSKAPTENLEDYFAQIDSYAFHLEAPISILCNYYRTIVRTYLSGNKKLIILDKSINDLRESNFEELKEIVKNLSTYTQLQITQKHKTNRQTEHVITDYRRLFRAIHTEIRSIDKLDPSSSFDEFSKVLFIKIINDKIPEGERLTVERIESFGTPKSQSQYIDAWFQEKVKEYYPGIFADNEKISLSTLALCTVLNMLNKNFNIKDTTTDIKGRAFEEFLPSQLRGKGLGQFFTPRPIVDFMIELANISITDKVLDFASGSGGFLIKAYDRKRQLIENTQKQYLDLLKESKATLLDKAKSQIFGIDAEPRAVRTAKMNMLLWGDGKQIQHGNGLGTKDYSNKPYLAKEYTIDDENSGIDVVLANPPFGADEKDQNILKNYSLARKSKQKNEDSGQEEIIYQKEKTEHLFIEKAFKILKPNGKLLIVLPEGIFSNSDSRVRDYIIRNFNIETIVKLPKHTFVMSGVDTINTVILIARKKSLDELKTINKSNKKTWINNNLVINFAAVNQIGFEPSGKSISNGYEASDLKILANKIISKNFTKLLVDPLVYANLEFGDTERNETWKKSLVKFLQISFDYIPSRLDPSYYFFYEESQVILQNFKSLPITAENLSKIRLTKAELDKDIEKTYKYVSVIKTIDGAIKDIEERSVDELLSTKKESFPQKLQKGDIVFNPYRINTGSVIYIDSADDNLITSPAYVVIRDIKMNLKYFVQLLKTPFMKYQIQILSSGSVRDSFSGDDLFSLKIPSISIDEQNKKVKEVEKLIKKIQKSTLDTSKNIEKINSILM